jgi:hypothetical protein
MSSPVSWSNILATRYNLNITDVDDVLKSMGVSTLLDDDNDVSTSVKVNKNIYSYYLDNSYNVDQTTIKRCSSY